MGSDENKVDDIINWVTSNFRMTNLQSQRLVILMDEIDQFDNPNGVFDITPIKHSETSELPIGFMTIKYAGIRIDFNEMDGNVIAPCNFYHYLPSNKKINSATIKEALFNYLITMETI